MCISLFHTPLAPNLSDLIPMTSNNQILKEKVLLRSENFNYHSGLKTKFEESKHATIYDSREMI